MRVSGIIGLFLFISGFMPLFASDGKIASQPPGEPFPWPQSTRLTVLEDLVLAIPAATIGQNEEIGFVIHSDPNAEIHLPKTSAETLIYLRLKKGMSVWLSKSVQGVVIATDKRPRQIRISAVTHEN